MAEDYRDRIIEEMRRNSRNSEERLRRERAVRRMKALIAVIIFVLVGLITLIVLLAKGVIGNGFINHDGAAGTKSSSGKASDGMDSPGNGDSQKSSGTDKDVSETGDAPGSLDLATTGDADEASSEKDFEIDMTFVGDCCMATNLENRSYGTLLWYADNYPTTYFFDGVRSYFEDDDITIANCENTFSDSSIGPRDKGEGTNFWFKAPTRFASVFTDNSIEAVTVNNNHTNDYGPEVFEDTKAALDAAGVQWGFRDKLIYYEKEGYKVAVVCVSYYYYEEAEGILPYLEQAKESSDYQIIFFHGGLEGQYQPEDWKVQACHMLVDNGADLILGAHPHVLQKREKYNGVDIVYSLGNFCFGGNDHPGSNRTIIYKYKLKLHQSGDIYELSGQEENIIPCYVYTGGTNNWQPAPIEDQDTVDRVLKYMNGELDSPD